MLGSTQALARKRVTLIGRSNIVGMPLYLLLNKYNAFVTLCFSYSTEDNIKKAVEESDIVIAACGVPGIVRASWLKEGAIVIDVGINYINVPDSK